MLQKSSREVLDALLAGVALVVLCISVYPQSATARGDQRRLGRPVPHHHHLYAMYRRPFAAPPASLPYAPEYGFLKHVPANAIGGAGYTFVPGVGILGESCDLPTSACTNEYRDVQ
jgi:hypothetical protein